LPENTVVLVEPTADRVRDALARLNARIRAEQRSDQSSLLFVFYSGHADAISVHLHGTRLPWDELRNLSAGSSASTRLMVIDACRSGQATRVKGTAIDTPFAVQPEASMPDGFAILSSATAGEAAQESDMLQGSFFTHHLLAALRGVADRNQDGTVTLGEAYAYTADRTVASTASTLSGVQHPTYAYDLKGRDDLVLTRPLQNTALASLILPHSGSYWIRERSQAGPLVLEAHVLRPTTVKVAPGRYSVQLRRAQRLYEGELRVESAKAHRVDLASMRSASLSEMVRKGDAARRSAYAMSLWVGAGTPLVEGLSHPWSLSGQLAIDFPAITFDVELSYQRSVRARELLDSHLDGLAFALGARRAFDLPPLVVSAGLRSGLGLWIQHFSGKRVAPSRRRWIPSVDALVRVDAPIAADWFWGIEARLRVSGLSDEGASGVPAFSTPAQALIALGLGRSW
ncbi:MAG: caspase family protein, partial [Deltaproteobacteria bacterium]|nr:caspase family protein [Deltaproteobacteria bacterium]